MSVRSLCKNMKQQESWEPAEDLLKNKFPQAPCCFSFKQKHDLNTLCGRFYTYLCWHRIRESFFDREQCASTPFFLQSLWCFAALHRMFWRYQAKYSWQ